VSVEAVKAAAIRREAARTPVGSLAGRYHGKARPFDLFWDADEQGYRRRFEAANARTVWDEAKAYSAAEVLTELAGSTWRRLTVAMPLGGG
jgi:hypothetical protein